jgi:hypothetical protein
MIECKNQNLRYLGADIVGIIQNSKTYTWILGVTEELFDATLQQLNQSKGYELIVRYSRVDGLNPDLREKIDLAVASLNRKEQIDLEKLLN